MSDSEKKICHTTMTVLTTLLIVQRNSVRQQWLQMVCGGLFVADVRMLLDKYPDFRFAISKWISTVFPKSLGFSYDTMDRLKEFVATLPEFKDVFDEYVSNLVSRDGRESELKKLATIFPQFKKLAEQYIKSLEETKKWLRELQKREHEEAMIEFNYYQQKAAEEQYKLALYDPPQFF